MSTEFNNIYPIIKTKGRNQINNLDTLEREILVMGTNEHDQPCDMRTYGFLTAIELMSQHNTSIVDDNILILIVSVDTHALLTSTPSIFS